MEILINAKCAKSYNDQNGNLYYAFVNQFGDRMSVKANYITVQPQEGQNCILKVRAVPNKEKGTAFLAFDCVSGS